MKSLAYPWNYDAFAKLVRGERDTHPLGVDSALATHEILMAIYESARLHERVHLPLAQESFPLDLILAETRASEAI
ncbi:MAG: hypothetical protein ACREIA_04465 [Opitutaceae bacterium]